MRAVLLALPALLVAAAPARAEVDPPSKWVRFEAKKLGLAVRHPANAKATVAGNKLTIAGPELATLTITVEDTKDRNSSKRGGKAQSVIDWTIAVPKRAAHCHAETEDEDQAVLASAMCDAIEVTPGARDPHVEIAVTSSGLADADAYEKAVRGKQRALDACWKAALAKSPSLPEGQLTVKRAFEDGAAASTNERAENFFDHDTKALGTCAFAAVEAVPVKTTEHDATVKIEMVCRLY